MYVLEKAKVDLSFSDECPYDAGKTEAGVCGCGVADVDSDGDSFLDCKGEQEISAALSGNVSCAVRSPNVATVF